MCNTSLLPRNFNSLVEPFSFPTFPLLRTRSRPIVPSPATDPTSYRNTKKGAQSQAHAHEVLQPSYEMERTPPTSPLLDVMENSTLEELPVEFENTSNLLQRGIVSNKPQHFLKSIELGSSKLLSNNTSFPLLSLPASSTTHLNHEAALPAFEYLTPAVRNISPVDFPLMELNRVGGIFPSFLHRRPRGEKRPIPEEQKDDKYYERRKRNNEAAKKSRDARKIREDRIAFRAAFLEQENSLLRAQIMALRDELQTMRQIIGRSNLNLN